MWMLISVRSRNCSTGVLLNDRKKHLIISISSLLLAAAFGYSNFHAGNLITVKLYSGKWKNFCDRSHAGGRRF